MWLVILIQCFTGSDVLRWRSFYSTHDTAWKAHYREVFDHGIREALCCLGRVKYLYGSFSNLAFYSNNFSLQINFFSLFIQECFGRRWGLLCCKALRWSCGISSIRNWTSWTFDRSIFVIQSNISTFNKLMCNFLCYPLVIFECINIFLFTCDLVVSCYQWFKYWS